MMKNPAGIIAAVEKAGYPSPSASLPIFRKAGGDEIEVLQKKRRLIVALVFAIPLFYIAMGPMIHLLVPDFLGHGTMTAGIIQLVLCIPVLIAGRYFYIHGTKALVSLHPNMDSLVAISTGTAVLYNPISA